MFTQDSGLEAARFVLLLHRHQTQLAVGGTISSSPHCPGDDGRLGGGQLLGRDGAFR